MKFLKILRVFVVAFFVLSALGSVAFAMDEALYQEIYKDLQTNTKTLSRNLVMFHRFHNPGLPQMEPHDPYWLKGVVGYRGPLFFKNDGSRDLFGPGTYAAVDPTSSTPFGKVLVEIEAQAGTNFLDTRSGTSDTEDGIKIRKSTYNALMQICAPFKRLNAKPYFKGKVEWISAKKADLYATPECQEMFNQAFRELKIQFLVYDWYTDDSNKTYAPCNTSSALAFVVMGALQQDGSINYDSLQIRGYTPEYQFSNLGIDQKQTLLTDPNSSFSRYFFIHEMARLSDPKKRGHDAWSIFDDVSLAEGSPSTIEKMKLSRFRCEKNKFAEDKSPVYSNKPTP